MTVLHEKPYEFNNMETIITISQRTQLALRSGGTIVNEVLPRRGYC